jgi:hypothetical protein
MNITEEAITEFVQDLIEINQKLGTSDNIRKTNLKGLFRELALTARDIKKYFGDVTPDKFRSFPPEIQRDFTRKYGNFSRLISTIQGYDSDDVSRKNIADFYLGPKKSTPDLQEKYSTLKNLRDYLSTIDSSSLISPEEKSLLKPTSGWTGHKIIPSDRASLIHSPVEI